MTLPSDFRHGLQPPVRRAVAAALLCAAVALAAAWSAEPGAAARPSGMAQQGEAFFLPHLVSAGPVTPTPRGTPVVRPTPWPTRPPRPPRPRLLVQPDGRTDPAPGTQGMVSFGESIVELQSLSERDQRVTMDLRSLNWFDDVSLARDIGPLGAVSVELKSQPGVTYSEYAAEVRPAGPLAALARTAWDGGAMAVYEVPDRSRDSILPLFALDVFSHTTVLQLTNTDPFGYDDIEMVVHDDDGSVLSQWTFVLEPGASGTIDPAYRAEFGALPGNVGAGFLGTLRFVSGRDTVIAAYGDDNEGRGVAGYVARDRSAAETVQYLPLVRANVDGNSLISVANAASRAVDVTISYLGAADSPSGAGQTFQQTFTVGPYHWGIVDLDPERRRGNVPVPGLPRGGSANSGFLGSATVEATGPVLALVLDQDARPIPGQDAYTILASAAYNGFGYNDLSAAWIVPRAYTGAGGRSTRIAVMNPRARPVTFQVEWGSLPDELTGTSGRITLPAGQVTLVSLPASAGDDVQVLVRAEGSVAALALDVGPELDVAAYWPIAVSDALVNRVPTLEAPPTAPVGPSPTDARPEPTGASPAPTAAATASATGTPPSPPTSPDRVNVFLPLARRT